MVYHPEYLSSIIAFYRSQILHIHHWGIPLPAFKPLPIPLYYQDQDGHMIIDTMFELGKLEEINGNIPGNKGVIAKNRKKKQVKVFPNGVCEVFDFGKKQ